MRHITLLLSRYFTYSDDFEFRMNLILKFRINVNFSSCRRVKKMLWRIFLYTLLFVLFVDAIDVGYFFCENPAAALYVKWMILKSLPPPLRKFSSFFSTLCGEMILILVTRWIIFGKRYKPKPTFRQYFSLIDYDRNSAAFSLVPLFARLTLKSQRFEICRLLYYLLISILEAVQRGRNFFYSRKN